MRVNMSDVKAFILKQKNSTFDVSSFLCKNTTVWTSGGIPATPAEYFTFTLLEDGTYSIKAKNVTNMPAELVLPTTYKGKAVTQIADFAFVDMDMSTGNIDNSYTTLEKITIPEGYTAVGEHAFLGCTNLKRVVFPSTMTTAGSSAFFGCSLVAMFIPKSVTEISSHLTNGSGELTVYCEAESQPEGWASNWNSGNKPVVWGYNPLGDDYLTFTEQADGTYSVKATDVSNLPSEVYIPFEYKGKAVTAIDDEAFYNATTVTRVVIPNGVTSIGYKAFSNCSAIVSIVIPDTVTSIGNSAFQWCVALTDVTLPSGITAIGDYTFFQCAALTSLTIPDTVTSIGQLAFAHTTFATIIIPLAVTTMGEKAFFNCTNLTINCEAASQPEGWDANWNVKDYNSNTHTANWGYTS